MNQAVIGRARTHDDLWGDDIKDGDHAVNADGTRILLVCPCGCGGLMDLPIYREGQPKPAPNAWLWNGDRQQPTLTPSIRDLSGCRFHGFLTGGVWTFCSDSGSK